MRHRTFLSILILLVVSGISGRASAETALVEADASYERHQPKQPLTENDLLNQASLHLAKKDYAQTEKLLKEAWEINPQSIQARLLWAKLYRAQGKKSLAKKILAKAITEDPNNDEIYVEAGNIFLGQGDFVRARQYFQKALSLDAQNEEAKAGVRQALAEEYKKKLASNPKDQDVATQLGIIYAQQGRLNDAEGLFSYVLRMNAKNDQVLAEMGWLEIRRKDPRRAKTWFAKALTFNPKNKSALQGMSRLGKAQSASLI